jgi:predicted mannosyl-3-phosphoglycerate phosphatase (HAD superfamily)
LKSSGEIRRTFRGGQSDLPASFVCPPPSIRLNFAKMNAVVPEPCLRQTSRVIYIAVDSLLPARGKTLSGFDEFTAALDHAGIPAVWLTRRSRLQFDEPRRRLGHRHPFIAEEGCAVYLPGDYFHLRPEAPRSPKSSTLRLGRFTCIPIAQPLPAAAAALEALSTDTGVPIVTLRSLSPRELAQNTGLPLREAELARQRDFDEVFFFAGASEEEIGKFLAEGRARKVDFRRNDVLWSAAIGASVQRCILELSRLYDRALHHHLTSIGIGAPEWAAALSSACDRSILLMEKENDTPKGTRPETPRMRHLPLHAADVWERLLAAISR